MTNDLISVIVPVYNAEKYLDKCVESITNQTYSNLEIILVDDGSPDNCPARCDEWAKRDSRIRVIHKENNGAAAARNSGIEISTGQYIAFVDSDDYIENDMYLKMMEINQKYDCEMVMCDCVKESAEESNIFTHDIRSGFYDKAQLVNEYFPQLLMKNDVNYPATISNGVILFKKNLIDRIKLRYAEGMRFSEDLLFGAIAVYNANSFYYMKGIAYYHYINNPNSVTHTEYVDKWTLLKALFLKINEYFSKATDYDFSKQINISLLFFVYLSIGSISGSNLKMKEKLIETRKVLNDDCVRKMFKELNLFSLDISWKLMIITLCYKYKIALRLLLK